MMNWLAGAMLNTLLEVMLVHMHEVLLHDSFSLFFYLLTVLFFQEPLKTLSGLLK